MNATVEDDIYIDIVLPPLVLPGFYPTSAPGEGSPNPSASDKVGPPQTPAPPNQSIPIASILSMDAVSKSKFFAIVLIVTSFIFLLSAWTIIWSYKKRKDDSVPFTSLWIAKEYHFISLQILINFAILGALILIGVLMERAGKPVFDLTIVIDVLIYLLLFTMAIWCCFLVKEKVEVYLNYVYKATDAYSRLHLLLLYTILASLFSLLAR